MRCPPTPLRWFLLVLTAAVVGWAGRGIYLSAIRALRHGATNMNTLVGLGTSVAFALLGLRHALARARPRGLLRRGSADRWISAAGQEPGRPRQAPRPGRARLAFAPAPGDRAPHRGWRAGRRAARRDPARRQRSGSARRALSGGRNDCRRPHHGGRIDAHRRVHAARRAKSAGACWPARSTTTAPWSAGRESLGEATVLAQITRMVEQAQGSRAPMERLADRASSIFVPVVLGLALRHVCGLAHRRAFAAAGAGQHRCRAGHRLSLRHGAGRARRAHRCRGPRRAAWRALQGRRSAGAAWRISTRSFWTRPAR